MAWLEGGTAVFAFRGTESMKDAIVDADARQAPVPVLSDAFPGVRGHVGARRQHFVAHRHCFLGWVWPEMLRCSARECSLMHSPASAAAPARDISELLKWGYG